MNRLLRELLAAHDGSVSLETFMQNALYHPDYGYYTTRIKEVGQRGDFATSATLHPILGHAIARWALHHRPLASSKRHWHIIEVGGGNGQLAQSVIRHIPFWPRRTLHYHIVDISGPLRSIQQQRLRFARLQWHEDIKDALAQADGYALIFSNELVDAFPCVQLTRRDHQWHEVLLQAQDNKLTETTRPFDDPRLASIPCTALDALADAADGQRCELHLSYHTWLASWLPLLQSGAILTIDYGESVDDLYYRRPHGTLRAYFQHLRMQGHEVYRNFSQQDLTADVNFSDLIAWGTQLGLHQHDYSNQRQFLLRWLGPKLEERANTDPQLAFLMNPHGVGGAFQTLCQSTQT